MYPRAAGDGSQVYYQTDPSYPFLKEHRGVFAATAGLNDVLREALAPFSPQIAVALTHRSVARGDEISASDVDLLIVGNLPLKELDAACGVPQV
ncbi:MAG TPA: nucleotidyltransferase domain-containing protein [Armatimonadota bacterium]|nr:nucleotidyltransferase domain-containing protein [Armatimonadota bacterium]